MAKRLIFVLLGIAAFVFVPWGIGHLVCQIIDRNPMEGSYWYTGFEWGLLIMICIMIPVRIILYIIEGE